MQGNVGAATAIANCSLKEWCLYHVYILLANHSKLNLLITQ